MLYYSHNIGTGFRIQRRNIMKKLSLIIAMVLLVTMGSVYAAWSYAQGASASSEVTREINMAQVNTTSNKGAISVTPSNFAFLVDDLGETDYVAALDGTGSLSILFTPAVGSDSTLQTTGITMKATITVKYVGTESPTYTGVTKTGATKTVVPLAPNTENGANVIDIVGNGIDGNTILTADDIVDALIFNEGEEIVLPTKKDNDDFHDVLKNYTIVVTISEVV